MESILNDDNKVFKDALGAVGKTPLIRLNRVSSGLKCELFAKCEFFNAGGSVKDRIGKRMLLKGQEQGKFAPGATLIEPTSGNTGIGLALSAAVMGYNMIATMPKKMSNEKIAVLKALGAKVVRTPTEAAFDDYDSHLSVAYRLNDSIENSFIPDQYKNENNPLAHYEETAEEIYQQCQGKVDMVVIGAGTGGTITGIAKKLKEKIPGVKIVGVDPVGSILAGPDNSKDPYYVEGIGYDFLPDVFDGSLVDCWYKSRDKESFTLARRIIKEEGLLVGGSSGSALAATLKFAAELGENQRCVVVFPDSVRNYLTKFVDDRWMYDHEYYDPEPNPVAPESPVSSLPGLMERPTIRPDATCDDAKKLFKESQAKAIAVVTEDGIAKGIISLTSLMNHFFEGKSGSELAKDAAEPVPRFIPSTFSLNRARFSLEINAGVCVLAERNEEHQLVYKGTVFSEDLFKAVM